MKKYLSLAVFIVLLGNKNTYAQDVYINLQYEGGSKDSFYVYMTPSFNRPGTFNTGPSSITLVFENIYASIAPPVAADFLITSVNGGSWGAQDFVQEPGPPNSRFVTFLNGSGAPIAGGVSFGNKVLLFRFRIAVGGNCIGTLRNYSNIDDPEDPSGTNSFSFLTYINEASVGDHFSTNTGKVMQTCALLILPVNILEFNARRENSNGVINWSVTGEEHKSSYYELERSLDGSNFQSIATINCRKLPGIQRYEYTDLNISRFNAKFVYYRVKQYDLDAKFIVSGVRQLRFDITDKGVQMYPNPVVTGFYVNVGFVNPDQSKVSLIIINSAGQPVQTREITSQQATNYYFDIQNAHLAAGDYYLKIVHNENVLDIKKFLKANE